MQKVDSIINHDLIQLRKHFQLNGFDIRLVGGCVRDLFDNKIPNDIDLCTDASPDEQLAIYKSSGTSYIATGPQHGTYTAVMKGIGYEITSLRTESQHDGRHAVMAFTKDWIEDLSRRDLTINAMALTFDGVLIDPFDGLTDLKNGIVRFVGDSEERMSEDFLRILRYFRFIGRFSNHKSAIEFIPAQSLYNCVVGLENISAERVWTELQKIMAHPSASWVIQMMEYHSVLDVLKLPGHTDHFTELKNNGCDDPVLLMMSMMPRPINAVDIEKIATRLKWSGSERKVALEISKYPNPPEIDELKFGLAVNGNDITLTLKVCEFFCKRNMGETLQAWVVPVFPVTGKDLISTGLKPGKDMGKLLFDMKHTWYNTGADKTKEELLSGLINHIES